MRTFLTDLTSTAMRALGIRSIGLWLLFGSLVFGAAAQPQDIRFQRFTRQDGLPFGVITAVLQDRQGFLWVTGWEGLARYDGYDFTFYRHDPQDTTSLSEGPPEWLYEDRTGTLWVGFNSSNDAYLNRFDREAGTFTRFYHDPEDPTSISDGSVSYIYEDRQDALWIGVNGQGLDRYDREIGTFTHYRHDPEDPTSLSDNYVRVIYEDRQGILWIGTGDPWNVTPSEGGLNRFDRERETFTRYLHDPEDEHSLIDNRVQTMNEDAEGTLWIGTWGDGLHRYDRQRDAFTRFPYDPANPDRLSSPHLERRSAFNEPVGSGVTFIHSDAAGMLWIGASPGGVNRYDPATGAVTHYEYDPDDPFSLGDNRAWRIAESHDGMLWIATWDGLNKVDPSGPWFVNHTFLNDPNDPSRFMSDIIRALFEDRSGILWVGTQRGGLYRYNEDDGTFTRIPFFSDDPENLLVRVVGVRGIGIYENRSGDLLVAIFNPLTPELLALSFDRQTRRFTPYTPDCALPETSIDETIFAIYEDVEGATWLRATWRAESGSIYYCNPEKETVRHFKYDSFSSIFEDQDSTLWLGTTSGLYRFDREAETFVPHLEGIDVLDLHVDQQGRFWAGTRQHGLVLVDREHASYTMIEGLPGSEARSILEDTQGNLWISTNGYLSRYSPDTGSFVHYDATDGILGNYYKAARSKSGALHFGGPFGLTTIFPDRLLGNAPPEVVLTGLRLFNEPVAPGARAPLQRPISETEVVRLSHDQNDLTLEYVALQYQHPEQNQYAYRLEGYEDAWRYVGAQRAAVYPNLPPGDYVFRVKAANSHGDWNEEGASVRVIVLPPWWRTTWAYVVYGLLFLAGVFAIDRFQRRRLLRTERERAMARDVEQARRIEALNVQLRAHEQQLKTQNTLLEQQKRHLLDLDAMKSRFFANISHEFRTPLTLLLGPLDDALREADTDLRFPRRQVTTMRRNARRLLRLINELLDLSKLEAGSMTLHARQANLVAFLRRVTLAFASRAERERITLSFHADEDTILTRFDPDKLEKVFTNLLSNAFKFTAPGGKIRLSVEPITQEGTPWVAVRVKDTGQGIPAEELPRVFDRFYQVDSSSTRAHEGTGIGLALVKELVELHEGRVTVESEVGFGTTFSVLIPLAELEHGDLDETKWAAEDERIGERGSSPAESELFEADTVEQSPSVQEAPIPEPFKILGTPKILIVEDNADMRAYVRDHLAGRYLILEAHDGLEGLEHARTALPDLVLADVMMPRMDGYALCQALKTDPALNHIPVILLTAKASEESKLEGLEHGADAYLYKPFSMRELLVRVENLIAIRRRLRARFSDEVVITPGEVVVSSEEAAFLERVRAVVEQHMADSSFGVEALAEEVGLGRRQLQRRMQEVVDLSPSGYLRMMRLERAAQLLGQEAGRVSEVGYAVGFGTAETFSRVFREVYGMPPSEYAARAKD